MAGTRVTFVAIAIGVVGLWLANAPAGAVQAAGHIGSPYQHAAHTTTGTCKSPGLLPACTASSQADRHAGTMTSSAGVDSGLDGTVPGAASSEAAAAISSTVDMARATAATFTVHIHVLRATATQVGSGYAHPLVSADAACDGCPMPYEQWVYPAGAEDDTLVITLLRPPTAARTATLDVASVARASIECDDFCMAPAGAAKADVQAVVQSVDVKFWGVGQPITPVISGPASGATVQPTTYGTTCSSGCQQIHGEQFSGRAEPGMPIVLRDGAAAIAQVQTDDTGHWVAYADLPRGQHRITAMATGPSGSALSNAVALLVAR